MKREEENKKIKNKNNRHGYFTTEPDPCGCTHFLAPFFIRFLFTARGIELRAPTLRIGLSKNSCALSS